MTHDIWSITNKSISDDPWWSGLKLPSSMDSMDQWPSMLCGGLHIPKRATHVTIHFYGIFRERNHPFWGFPMVFLWFGVPPWLWKSPVRKPPWQHDGPRWWVPRPSLREVSGGRHRPTAQRCVAWQLMGGRWRNDQKRSCSFLCWGGKTTVVGNFQQQSWNFETLKVVGKTYENHSSRWNVYELWYTKLMWDHGTSLDLMIEKCWTHYSSHEHPNSVCECTKKDSSDLTNKSGTWTNKEGMVPSGVIKDRWH